MKVFGLILLILCALNGHDHDKAREKKSFSAIQPQLVQYRTLVEKAWERKDEELAQVYSDSVKYSIIGSYVDNHAFTTLKKQQVVLGKLNKPVMLITSASWCGPCMFEIPALNKIAEEYTDKIVFIVLFQDMVGDKLAKVAGKYSKQMLLVPSVEQAEGISVLSISGFRHIAGFPTNYLINNQNRIIGFEQGAYMPMTYVDDNGQEVTTTAEEANARNYSRLKEEVELLLSES